MATMRASCSVLAIALVLSISAAAQEPAEAENQSLETAGAITAVTVYQGQALVTREIDLGQTSGLWEVVVTGLPESVMPASLYAEPVDGAQIRSVRYRVRPVEEDVRQEVRELDQQIQQVGDQVAAVEKNQHLLEQRLQYLDKLENFTATTSQKELSEGVLDAATLTELSQYLFDQRQAIAEQQLELDRRMRELQEQLQVLQRQRELVAGSSARAVREAVVFANVPPQAGGKLRLRYLVNQATWTPSYVVRAAADESQVQVEYYANVQQMSGEDWVDVEMTISTATPSLMAKAPELEPLAISLAQPNPNDLFEEAGTYADAKARLSQQKRALVEQRNRAEIGAGGSYGPQTAPAGAGSGYGGYGMQAFLPAEQMAQAQRQSDLALNSLASSLQLLDLSQPERFVRSSKRDAPSTEGVSVSYHLDGLTSLPSRADRQLVQIASLGLKGSFYRLAIPVLTSYVYREAEVTNGSDLVLLAGPASTFVGDQFVGQADLPTVAVGQAFTVGLGIDSSLRTERTLAQRDERIQGGNRLVELSYDLTVENFGQEPTEVRLMDRLPMAEQAEVRVTLTSSDQPVSEDPEYQSDRKKGILRWDVTIPAQAVGAEHFSLTYAMRLEYDKQFTIAQHAPQP